MQIIFVIVYVSFHFLVIKYDDDDDDDDDDHVLRDFTVKNRKLSY